MQALILAGGLGTRLRSVVSDRPKAMAEVNGKPFLVYQLEQLRQHHIVEVVLCVGFMHEVIEDYFGDGSQWNMKIRYSVERALLGTAGALKLAESVIGDTFLLLNGDTFFETDLSALIAFHCERRQHTDSTLGTVALTQVDDASRFGAIELEADDRIVSFAEKTVSQRRENWINAGIYVLDPEVLSMIPPAQKVSLEKEVFPAILRTASPLYGFRAQGFFVDIGTPEGLGQFTKHL